VARFIANAPKTVSALLANWQAGDDEALRAAVPLVYSELRRIAHRYLQKERQGHTLQSTAPVHEAYLRLVQSPLQLQNRTHFFAVAARLMREILVDHARSRQAQKRGGQFEITTLGTDVGNPVDGEKLARISEALDELAKAEPALAEVVDLKFFCGFSFQEIAAMRDVSERTVQRQWEKARIYLHRTIRAELEV